MPDDTRADFYQPLKEVEFVNLGGEPAAGPATVEDCALAGDILLELVERWQDMPGGEAVGARLIRVANLLQQQGQ